MASKKRAVAVKVMKVRLWKDVPCFSEWCFGPGVTCSEEAAQCAYEGHEGKVLPLFSLLMSYTQICCRTKGLNVRHEPASQRYSQKVSQCTSGVAFQNSSEVLQGQPRVVKKLIYKPKKHGKAQLECSVPTSWIRMISCLIFGSCRSMASSSIDFFMKWKWSWITASRWTSKLSGTQRRVDLLQQKFADGKQSLRWFLTHLLWNVMLFVKCTAAAQESNAAPGVKANGAIKFCGKRTFKSWSCLSSGLTSLRFLVVSSSCFISAVLVPSYALLPEESSRPVSPRPRQMSQSAE